ncbi:hypothetical protein [Marinobacter sp. HL-58]|uniref:hypothetical protein n=1 Tax=Marinobacter sp. HL-58 TaxID=1479237 RepID=UPI000B24F7E1|nr:hypothetical protein [Marinobacter sp. HL-58]
MNEQNRNWWAGVADIAATGLNHGASKLERVHLSIADETFDILQRVPVTRPWSEGVRHIHHGISRLSYRSVSLVASSLGMLARTANSPESFKPDIKLHE